MKLISCDSCGVVLDQDKLPFAKDIYKYDGESEVIDERRADYNQLTQTWAAFVPCPVCNETIFEQ